MNTARTFAVAFCAASLFCSVSIAEHNVAPSGFVSLFNGKDLSGWRGNFGHGTPRKVLAMDSKKRAAEQKKADESLRANWKVENGEIVNPLGKGAYLETDRNYADFELLMDWKIGKGADSGIYLRGTPQVQIWDPVNGIKQAKVGSGGLYNNKRGPSKPLVKADKPVGEWNKFRILLIGDICSIWLNDQLVVNEVALENYWDRSQPLWTSAPIQIQTHDGELRFRNIFIREISRKPPESGVLDRHGKPVGEDWRQMFTDAKTFRHEKKYWALKDGVLTGTFTGDPKHHHCYTDAEFDDFELHAMVKMSGERANSGIVIRGKPTNFDNMPGYQIDMGKGYWGCLWEERRDGMVDKFPEEKANALVKKDGWNHYYVIARGHSIQAWLNGVQTINVEHPRGIRKGALGFQLAHGNNRNFVASFKDVYIRPLRKNPSIGFIAPLPSQDEKGFVNPLASGNLDGWTGNGKKGYKIEDGKLVCPRRGGGNIYINKEYKDFIFRFEFKLQPGGNNGLGIHAVLNTDAAYNGHELQILENTSPGYAKLQDYQYHGSIYDIVGSIRGHQVAVGGWNYQEVTVRGDHIKVVLNGKTIIDNVVSEHKTPRVVKRHKFPEKGYIGFLGHGARLEFRNIRVKELK
ncbi:MAG: DUF1080 domain-containing protein [Planctomycetota bacterium]